MTRRRIFWLWLPLALSFTLMMLEGPTVQAALARLGEPVLNLAAFGLVLSISLIIESPVIMLISTAIALARDGQSYRALWRFMVGMNVVLTVLTALIAWTPLYGLLVEGLLSIPPEVSAAARPALQIMLLWTAAIGWRRFYQGLLVRHGLSARVSYGTAIRLLATVAVAAGFVIWPVLPGAQVGACALMAGVLIEALVTYLFALPLVRQVYLADQSTPQQPLTIGEITQFHLPLAATSLLTLLLQPITAAALARMSQPKLTLAAWPVIFGVMLVLRGWGMALQETTVAQAEQPNARRPLRDFSLMVAAGTSLAAALLALTPLLDWYLQTVLSLEPELWSFVRLGLQILILLPAFTAITNWLRGLLVVGKTTASVYRGMGINLFINSVILIVGVLLQLPGIAVAATALLVAIVVESIYLQRRVAAVSRQAATVSAPMAATGS
jgi:hypothetical protein